MSYRFKSSAETALDNYIAEHSFYSGYDIRELEMNSTNTLISILLYENDGSIGFTIGKKDGKVKVHYDQVDKDSNWRNVESIVEFLQGYIELVQTSSNSPASRSEQS
jgi:hypothetical protein